MKQASILYLEISCWAGVSIGARHYYAKIRDGSRSILENINEELREPISQAEAKLRNEDEKRRGNNTRWGRCKAGDLSSRFAEEVDVIRVALAWVEKNAPDVVLIRGSGSTAQPQPVVYGERKESLNAIYAKFNRLDRLYGWDKRGDKMNQLSREWYALLGIYDK